MDYQWLPLFVGADQQTLLRTGTSQFLLRTCSVDQWITNLMLLPVFSANMSIIKSINDVQYNI